MVELERVARALCRHNVHYGDPEHEVDARVNAEWKGYRSQARAAIAALGSEYRRGIEDAAGIAEMHDHRGDISRAIRALATEGEAHDP